MTATLVHVDVDNLWIAEEEFNCTLGLPPAVIFETALPRFLQLFRELKITATFFVVGRDVELYPEARDFCRAAIAEGHEIANHSFSHRVDFADLDAALRTEEITKAHRALESCTGIAPVGFRGPGYYCDAQLLKTLAQLGYKYDSSLLPGWANLAMKTYFVLKNRSPAALRKRFGKLSDVLASGEIHSVPCPSGSTILEIPLSTIPLLRMPFHTTFIYQFGEAYLALAQRMIRHRPPGHLIHLFHAADLFDFSKVIGVPAVNTILPAKWSLERKENLMRRMLSETPKTFTTATALTLNQLPKVPQPA